MIIMVNYSIPSLLILTFLSVMLLSCNKDPLEDSDVDIQNEDYRLEFIGNYICIGTTHDWNEATGLDEYSKDTITLIVKIDSISNNMIYANNDLIPIDTNGYFAEFYFPGYHDYMISFFTNDSVRYYIETGGLGGGHWGGYLGSKK